MGTGRDQRLDGLRALAVLAVMAFHIGLLPWGGAGVDVFFVLSGWLITNILQREIEATGNIKLLGFFWRRAVRILPALWVLLIVYIALSSTLWPGATKHLRTDLTAALLFLSDWREGLRETEGPIAHTWSLAVEMQFYFLWPAVLLALNRIGRDQRVICLMSAWFLLTILRAIAMHYLGHFGYYLAFFHCTGLLLGSALALRPIKLVPKTGAAAVVGFAIMTFLPKSPAIFPWLVTAGEIMAAMIISAPPLWLAWKPLASIGLISYGMYLWHAPIMRTLSVLPPWSRPPIELALTVIIAAVSFRFIEAPVQRLAKGKHFRSAWGSVSTDTWIAGKISAVEKHGE